MKNYKNVIYILTNPLYAGYIKIGYASDLQQRLASLNTGMLRNFEPYAVYETNVKNADKEFHAIIDDLAPIVRARVIQGQKVQDKEFFKLEPEQAYDLLKHIANMTDTRNCLHRHGEVEQEMSVEMPVLKERHTSTKPSLCCINNDSHNFVSWIDSLIWYCEYLVKKVGFSTFKNDVLPLQPSHKQSQRKLFATTEEEMRGFGFYKFPEGNLYLLTNYSASSIQNIVRKIGEVWPEYQMSYQYNDIA